MTHSFTATRLLAIGLELPEETLVNLHGFSSVGETSGEHLNSTLYPTQTNNLSQYAL
jgi:hypothetical protein